MVGKSESIIGQELQIRARYYDCTLMRNNNGCLLDDTGRPVRYGLGNISKQQNDKIKSSDYVGFTKIKVTPDMVGKELAIFTAIEAKKEDWNPDKKLDKHEQAQFNFIQWIINNGGYAGFAKSVDDIHGILNRI